MRKATILLNIIRERARRGLPVVDIYRTLYQRDLYLLAYSKLHKNEGALTPGTTSETVDGLSLNKIGQIIESIRFERFRWTPVRRTYIPKKNEKSRPLGLPVFSDKLLQEVIRLILEAYYEPRFSDASHGFRHRKYVTTITNADGCYKVLQVKVERSGKLPLEAHFGGVSLKWNKWVRVDEHRTSRVWSKRSEVVERLLADKCELCGQEGPVEMHHIRKLTDLQSKYGKQAASWKREMAMR